MPRKVAYLTAATACAVRAAIKQDLPYARVEIIMREPTLAEVLVKLPWPWRVFKTHASMRLRRALNAVYAPGVELKVNVS